MDTPEQGRPDKEFTEETDEYVVLKLTLAQYKDGDRKFPAGCGLADAAQRSKGSGAERRLLKRYFRNWKAPYRGRLKGWRPDSPLLVLRDGRLIAGVYLVAENEFDADPKWGQLHYAFMDPSCKGQGIYSALFREAVQRARAWGMTGLYLSSNRHLLPEVYMRWGAEPWRTVPKGPRRKRRGVLGSLLRFLGSSR